MINTKLPCAVAILSLAIASYGTPAHACNRHGGFGMQRFNPFQAEPYDNNSSMGASLRQGRNMTPIPKTQDTDKEPAKKTAAERQQDVISRATSDPAADRAMFH